MDNKYDYLKDQYPELISLNQFCKICHIAKRNAVYLLKHGIVPCTNTRKKTWKYIIRLDDVISYLVTRELEGSKIPPGAVPNRNKKNSAPKKSKGDNFRSLIKPGEGYLVRQYFKCSHPDCPEILSTAQVSTITGLSIHTIRNRIRCGDLYAMEHNGVYVIPKKQLYRFLSSPVFLKTTSHSESFKKNLASFEKWKTQA